MEHDEKILKYIAKNENISQRQLAKHADLSLGNLNLILHKLVSKGFITIEKINTRNLRYILTPKGIARNTKRTYNYIQSAIKLVLTIDQEISQIYKQYMSDGYSIYIDGNDDEIRKILKQAAREKKLSGIEWLEKDGEIQNNDSKTLVIVWQAEKEELYKRQGVEYINLLDRID
jgi:DNA-binding MarR family transcriptional regulator